VLQALEKNGFAVSWRGNACPSFFSWLALQVGFILKIVLGEEEKKCNVFLKCLYVSKILKTIQ
jgi:hypothetical protein